MKGLLPAALILLILFTGCAAQEGPSPADASPPTASAALPEEPTAQPEEPAPEGPAITASIDELPRTFIFCSGAGAWSTELNIESDFSFSGLYIDADMGGTGEGYPHGTQYISRFTGQFSQPEQVNDYTWSVRLESIQLDGTPGQESIEDGVRLIYSEPYGLDDAQELLIYLPNAPASQLPEMFMNWTTWARPVGTDQPEYLPFWGLYNTAAQQGFVGDSEEDGGSAPA